MLDIKNTEILNFIFIIPRIYEIDTEENAC